jgi:hypothetical protein
MIFEEVIQKVNIDIVRRSSKQLLQESYWKLLKSSYSKEHVSILD